MTTHTALPPTGLLCELMAYPERTVIRNPRPKFGWIFNDAAPNAHQVAYQILVASDERTLARDEGDMWDSGLPDPGGKWASDNTSHHIPYDGKPLASDAIYYWKVRTWNAHNQASLYSESQAFCTGELTEAYTTAWYPLEKHSIEPLRVVQVSQDRTFVDFGRAAFGTVLLTLTSPSDGEVEVHLGEAPAGSHAIDPNPGGSRRYKRLALLVRKGTHTYTVEIPTDERNTGRMAILMPVETGEVYPFRYCEIEGAPVPVRRDDIRQIAVSYPFDDNAAHFTSSSKVLNDVWDLCHYTMKATSFCGVYVDGDRERIPYEADAYINQLGHYCCDREFTMARYTHEYLMTHPTWPTEWILDSVLIAWNDYMQTGDASSLAHFYTDLQAKTLTPLAREDGLISTQTGLVTDEVLASTHFKGRSSEHFTSGMRDIVDWPQGERDGYDMRPVNTVVNALHYRAVVLMGRIADALGKTEDGRCYRARAQRVKQAVQEKLVDPETGLMLDGEGSTHSSLHANMFALALGLVAEKHVPEVVRFVKGKGMACSVYASQFLMEAFYRAGEGEYALSLLTSTAERGWAHMIYDVGSTIALEAWDNRFKPNQDWNHAWGAAPASLIPRGLMGINPLEPGFEKILIRPQPGPLAFAEMTMPTIRGAVTVRFNNRPGASFFLEVDIPGNTSARVGLPRMGGDDPTVSLDGKRVLGTAEGAWVFVDDVGSGPHTLERHGR